MTRRTLAHVAAQVAAMAGLLAGCGGGGTSKPLTESDFCSQKATAECQVADRCVNDKDACKSERMAMCTAFAANAKASGKRKFVAGNVGACISKVTAVYAKTSPITPKELADMDDVCNYVFQGTGEVALDMCDVKYDCKGKVICDKGFCAMQTNVTAGCGNPGDTCPTGKYCTPNSAGNPTCMERGAKGDPCDATKPCLETLHCAGTMCDDRVMQAGSCTTSDDCAPSAPFCDPYAGNKCDPGLSFSSGSHSCDDFGGNGSTPGTGGSNGGSGGSGGAGGGAGGRGGAGGSSGGTGGSGTGGSGTGGGAGGTTGTGGAGGTTGTAGAGGTTGTAGAGGTTGTGGGAGGTAGSGGAGGTTN
jgi:hypothetical protein